MPVGIAYKLIGGLVAVLMLVILVQNRNHWKAKATELQTQIAAADKAARESEASAKKIAAQLRKQTDEENRRIAGDADALRLSGPGKARCTPIPSGPGGHNETTAKPDAAGPALPPDDSAAVPWGWIVIRAEEHDRLLNEVKAWRTWHDEVLKVWPKTTEAPAR